MKNDGLTELEIKVMEAARRTDYGDCLEYPQWSFAVASAAGMSDKVYRGVVASLIKKGLVGIEMEGKDAVFAYTAEGKKRFES